MDKRQGSHEHHQDRLVQYFIIPEGYTFKYTEGNKVSDRID